MTLDRRQALIGLGALALARRSRSSPGFAPYPMSVSAVAGGGFFSDPYSSYPTTYYVNASTGNDSWDGTSPTFVSGTTGPKQTIPAAIALYATGGTRIIVAAGIYNISSVIAWPNYTGASSSARIVLQGDPASATLPQIVFANSAANVAYFQPNKNGVRNWIVFRKLDLTTNTNSSSPTGATGMINYIPDNPCNGISLQYLNLHDNFTTDNTAGFFYQGGHQNVEVTQCKGDKIQSTVTAHNGAAIFTYTTPNTWVHECTFTNCGVGVFHKRCSNASSNNGPLLENLILGNCTAAGLLFSEQGAGDTGGFFDTIVRGCLFYGSMPEGAISVAVPENTMQSSRFQAYNNTFAPTVQMPLFMRAMTNIQFYSNILMGLNEQIELDHAFSWVNTFAVPTGGTGPYCDYNAYLTTQGQQWWLDRFGGSSVEYTSVAAWKALTGRAEFPQGAPDANCTTFTNVLANFPNSASNNFTLDPASLLKGSGYLGGDPGYNSATAGAQW